MRTSTFKETLTASGPDRPRSPMLSREERLARSMPPPVVELLEHRRLLSWSSELNGSTLEITGSSNADNITVNLNGGTGLLDVSGDGQTVQSYSPTAVSLIKILAGAGDDRIVLSNTNIGEVCLVYGEGGNDNIDAGNAGDTVYGGDGTDTVDGHASNDLIYGGADTDLLIGGTEADVIHGEGGGDDIRGDAGNDQLYGGDGNDTIDCAAGTDKAYGDNGNDDLTDGDGPDSLYGGAGNDTFHASPDGTNDYFDGEADTDTLLDRLSGDSFFNMEVY